jgi:3-phosphoglycerate kinase
MGLFETQAFSAGTFDVARALAKIPASPWSAAATARRP